ncbi:MAG: hypothetical protein HKO89_05430 [Saprospiraceae bacterium]|nr:nuclear transport factor 2 family protein [Bacteroidia bacterium]NNK90031.1 hypothetical protein [Saprospiraceae bacterium]
MTKQSLLILFLSLSCHLTQAQDAFFSESKAESNIEITSEYTAVESAILDYVEALYLVDSTRMERSVSPNLRKIGYWKDPKTGEYRDNLNMTYEQLVSLSARWNTDGKSADEDSVKEIDIYDINDRTASAKLTAVWGIDYMHLAKIDGKWLIMNVIWQSHPEE